MSCSVDFVTLVDKKAVAPTHSNLHMRARYAIRATMLWKWSESAFCSLGDSSSILYRSVVAGDDVMGLLRSFVSLSVTIASTIPSAVIVTVPCSEKSRFSPR